VTTATATGLDRAEKLKTIPIVSADSHISPRLELYQERLPAHLRHRAPRIEKREKGDYTVVEGQHARRVGEAEKKPHEREPEDRLKDLALDGVVAEVMYGGGARMGDAELSLAIARVNNDWLAETFSPYRDRFAAGASIPMVDIDEAVKELRRAAKLGLRPAVLPDHVDERPWNSPDYDPFWAAAEELGMPLSFHVGFGRDPVRAHGPGGAITNYALVNSGMIETISHLASGGILERFPGLRVTMVECGIGWLAWAMQILDEAHVKHAHWARPRLAEPPSFYIRRQMTLTFQEDAVGLSLLGYTGANTVMWGNDYPHHEGTWPHSREVVARLFADLPEAETRQIIHENAKKLYGFAVD
jgi:predicted TIM-barrel fold metal-dependent hydrolase